MTKETARELLPIMGAIAEGKAIQSRSKGGADWQDFDHNPSLYNLDYRIKPEPQFRPWTYEEVPICALLRIKDKPNAWRGMITACNDFRIFVTTEPGGMFFETALETKEHSTDNGKTWKPCGIQISGEVAL